MRRHWKLTQLKKDRQSVRCSARVDKSDARTSSGADVIVVVPYIWVPTYDPNIRVTGRHYVKKENFPWLTTDQNNQMQPLLLSLVYGNEQRFSASKTDSVLLSVLCQHSFCIGTPTYHNSQSSQKGPGVSTVDRRNNCFSKFALRES